MCFANHFVQVDSGDAVARVLAGEHMKADKKSKAGGDKKPKEENTPEPEPEGAPAPAPTQQPSQQVRVRCWCIFASPGE